MIKNFDELTEKDEITGDEKLVISEDEYVTVGQIGNWVAEANKNLDITQFLLTTTGTVTEAYYNSLLSALGEMDKISVGGYANSTDIDFIVPITIAKDAGDNIVISFYFGLLMANSLTLITISSDYSWTMETVDLATKSYVTNAISNITIPSTEGLATETYVNTNLASKAEKITLVDATTTTTTTQLLQPNKLYVFGEVSSLTISLVDGEVTDEYMFRFTSGSTPTTLTLPSSIKWAKEVSIETGDYEFNISGELGMYAKFE